MQTTERTQVHVDLDHTRQHVGLFLDHLDPRGVTCPDSSRSASHHRVVNASVEDLITPEVYALLQDASRLPFSELHSRWQSLLANRPQYPAGLLSLSTLSTLSLSSSTTSQSALVQAVEEAYQQVLADEDGELQ